MRFRLIGVFALLAAAFLPFTTMAQNPPDPDPIPAIEAELAKTSGSASALTLKYVQITARRELGTVVRPGLEFRWRGVVVVEQDLYRNGQVKIGDERLDFLVLQSPAGTTMEVFGYAVADLQKEEWLMAAFIDDPLSLRNLGFAASAANGRLVLESPEGQQALAEAKARVAERERAAEEEEKAQSEVRKRQEEEAAAAAERLAAEQKADAERLAAQQKADAERKAAAGAEAALAFSAFSVGRALLHKSSDKRTSPIPGQTHPTA